MPSRLLVVEDDEDIREVVAEDLEHRGYLVDSAPNGRAALDRLRAVSGPMVTVTIVLDLMMPLMNGWEFLKEIRTDGRLRNLPVVVTTGAEDPGDLPPDVPVLRKPYKVEDLVRIIERQSSKGA